MKPIQKIFLISLAAAAASGAALQRVRSIRQWRAGRQKFSPEMALVTGASSGIGSVFAKALARDGYNLILVARRVERLQKLADELQGQYGVSAEVLPADLSLEADVERVARRIEQAADLTLLVNNAGFGTGGSFDRINIEPEIKMVRVHIEASMRLARAALPGMVRRGHGGIINVSSLGAFAPMPSNITYGATKAFLNSFSAGLNAELAGSGVRVQTLCPGFTYTELKDAIDTQRANIPSVLWMQAEPVVAASLQGLREGKVLVIPGLLNRLIYLAADILPFGGLAAVEAWGWKMIRGKMPKGG